MTYLSQSYCGILHTDDDTGHHTGKNGRRNPKPLRLMMRGYGST